MPEEVQGLIDIARIKILCIATKITKIQQRQNKVLFYFSSNALQADVIERLIKKYRNQIKFSGEIQGYITYTMKGTDVIKETKEFLKNC